MRRSLAWATFAKGLVGRAPRWRLGHPTGWLWLPNQDQSSLAQSQALNLKVSVGLIDFAAIQLGHRLREPLVMNQIR
ncbi:uncharacterized protein VTP21DRAFT_7764 [Calcarisporiella thermophila]|uniref:uncharacterized protein n=1 Tax=Calcarisporiella thermophila TaxID=911321 RepID=UPI003743963A